MANKKVKVGDNQTIWDIALQEYGDVTGVYQILKDNEGIDLDADLVPGSLLIITQKPLDAEVTENYTRQQIKPANLA